MYLHTIQPIVYMAVMRSSFSFEALLLGTFGGALALYEGIGWIAVHYGIVSLPVGLIICLLLGLLAGLHWSLRG